MKEDLAWIVPIEAGALNVSYFCKIVMMLLRVEIERAVSILFCSNSVEKSLDCIDIHTCNV